MLADFFAAPSELLLGALTGLAFGFVLQKGGVTRYEVIVGQFLLRDFTVLKVMLTAIVVGGAGIWLMKAAGADFPMHVKGAAVLANALGGAIFGVGMAVLGYCPGTGVAAVGAGSRHAGVGVLGMLFGAFGYALAHPFFAEHVLPVGDLGKATLESVTGVPGWAWFVALTGGGAALMVWLERRETAAA